MTRLLSLIGVPALPYDVLRLVFEEATRKDTRKAVKYALISKLVRNWVEACLYEDVRLYREESLRKFLRTLQSSTKSTLFFATRVKSLSLVYDIHEIDRTTRILSICTGVENLTIWAVPTQIPPSFEGAAGPLFYDNSHSLAPPRILYHPPPVVAPVHHYLRHQSHNYLHTLTHHLRPKRLSILIHSPLHIPITYKFSPTTLLQTSPNFSLGLFSHLTHLTIMNGWAEWSSWAWSWSDVIPLSNTVESLAYHNHRHLEPLPNLTHLSLEIQVGKCVFPKGDQRCLPPFSPADHRRRTLTLTERVGRALARILASPELSPHLRVLVCVISFDDTPSPTAHKIRQETMQSLIAFRSELGGRDMMVVPTAPIPVLGGGSGSYTTKVGGRGWDPRLVFAYDQEPFREREAGSAKAWHMWKRAEEIVRLQKQGHGYLDREYFVLTNHGQI